MIAWRDLDARTSFSVTDLKKKWDMRRGCRELEANVGVKGLRNLALLCCMVTYQQVNLGAAIAKLCYPG